MSQEFFMLQRRKGMSGHPIFFDFTLEEASCGRTDQESPHNFFYTSCTKQPVVFLCKQDGRL